MQVLLMMNESMSRMLQNRSHIFLLVIRSWQTWHQIIFRIFLEALWWKLLSLLHFFQWCSSICIPTEVNWEAQQHIFGILLGCLWRSALHMIQSHFSFLVEVLFSSHGYFFASDMTKLTLIVAFIYSNK